VLSSTRPPKSQRYTANQQRQKTAEQIGRAAVCSGHVRSAQTAEYTEVKRIEAERAKLRQAEQAKLNQPQTDNGKSREIAARKVGVGYDTAEKAAAVVQAIEETQDAVTLDYARCGYLRNFRRYFRANRSTVVNES